MTFRFLTGFGVAEAMVITNSYLAEFFPSSVRGKYISFCAMIGLIGVPITNIVSAFVIPLGSWGWRLVFVWGAVGLIYFSSSTVWKSHLAGTKIAGNMRKPMRSSPELKNRLKGERPASGSIPA